VLADPVDPATDPSGQRSIHSAIDTLTMFRIIFLGEASMEPNGTVLFMLSGAGLPTDDAWDGGDTPASFTSTGSDIADATVDGLGGMMQLCSYERTTHHFKMIESFIHAVAMSAIADSWPTAVASGATINSLISMIGVSRASAHLTS